MDVAPITPEGMRAGDPDALRGLVVARGPSVVAFCAEVCGAEIAARAGAEAFARFRAAVHDAGEAEALDPEALLLGGTRHAAASMARVPNGPRFRRRESSTCQLVPTLLAARAAGALSAGDQERLDRHLGRCAGCRAIAAGFARGEQAYARAQPGSLPEPTAARLVAALAAAAPLSPEHASSPARAPSRDDARTWAVDGTAANGTPANGTTATPTARGQESRDDDLGATMEWQAPDDEPGSPDPPLAAAPDLLRPAALQLPQPGLSDVVPAGGRERRGPPSRLLRLVLPLLVVAASVVGALGAAGVLGGDEPTPPTESRAAERGVEQPVTTPLPVTGSDADADGTVTLPLQP